MPYAKLYRDITRSSINEEELHVRWMFVVLLTNCNRTGQVYGTISSLARVANIREEQAQAAMDRLQEPDPSSTTPDEDGRRIISLGGNLWQVVNYAKYRDMRDEELEREQTRERVRRHREKATIGNAPVTPGNDPKRHIAVAADEATTTPTTLTPDGLLLLWNGIILEAKKADERIVIKTATRMNADREKYGRARLAEESSESVWREAISRIVVSPGCNGHNDRKWIANFDFLLRRKTLTMALEGRYDDGAWESWPKAEACTETRDEVIDGDVIRVEYERGTGRELRRWKV